MSILLYICIPVLIGVILYKSLKRNKTLKTVDPTPEQIAILENNVRYYQRLNDADKAKFAKRTAIFLANVRFKAVGCKIEELDRVLVGASAVIPMFGFDHWMYPNIKVIYIFPNAFNENFEYFGNANNRFILGMVGQGKLSNKMVLSQQALRHGFANTTDKHNTAIHEFVHLIDLADGDVDGIPELITEQPYTLPWIDLIHKKIELIDDGKSDINPYGATSKHEFFAVVSEYFFERPDLLKRKHPKLYEKLSKFFNQRLG